MIQSPSVFNIPKIGVIVMTRNGVKVSEEKNADLSEVSRRLLELNENLKQIEDRIVKIHKDVRFSSSFSPIGLYLQVQSRWKPSELVILDKRTRHKLLKCSVSVSAFREFWKEELNRMFREWLRQNDLPDHFYIDDYSDEYEPFQYAVWMKNDKINGKKIMWFHLKDHTYEPLMPTLTKEEVLERGKTRERELRQKKRELERELRELQDVLEKPYLYMFGSFEAFFRIFFRYERTMKNFKTEISNLKREIGALTEEIARNREKIKEEIVELEEIEKGIDMIKPLFEEVATPKHPGGEEVDGEEIKPDPVEVK